MKKFVGFRCLGPRFLLLDKKCDKLLELGDRGGRYVSDGENFSHIGWMVVMFLLISHTSANALIPL